MVITFSGLDGSGKSTIIRSLAAVLEARHTTVVVCHMTYDIGLLAAAQAVANRLWRRESPARPVSARRSSGRALVPGPAKGPGSRTPSMPSRWKRLRSAIVWNKPCRRVVYLADLVIFIAFRFYVERVRKGVLIMDRYFYDTLVDIAGPRSWPWARFLAWLTPTPTLALLVDISAEEAFARKGEFSVEYLRHRSQAYRRVFRWVPSAIVLDNTDLARTTSEITRLVAGRGRP